MDKLNPQFNFPPSNISANDIQTEAETLLQPPASVVHKEILKKLLGQINKIDFRKQAGFIDDTEKLGKKTLSGHEHRTSINHRPIE